MCVDGVGCLLSSRIIFFSKGKIVVCFSIEMSMRSHIMEHTLIFFFSFFSNMKVGNEFCLWSKDSTTSLITGVFFDNARLFFNVIKQRPLCCGGLIVAIMPSVCSRRIYTHSFKVVRGLCVNIEMLEVRVYWGCSGWV